MYRVTLFKRLQEKGPIYGAKHYLHTLDVACTNLTRRFGQDAPVEVLGPGYYSVARGAAELEIVRNEPVGVLP